MDKIFILVPCYNEEIVLPETFSRLGSKLHNLIEQGLATCDSRVLFIDDGSVDKTWELISKAHENDEIFCGISLDQNRGHQTALTEGLIAALDHKAVSISIDADLQDDVDAIDEMLSLYYAGSQIVCGVRQSRETDTFFKRNTAHAYYNIMRLLGSPLLYDHADFRLMGVSALEKFSYFHGDDLFLRGLIMRLGYEPSVVYYDRSERFAGESKYTLKKMVKLALKGMSSGKIQMADSHRVAYLHTKFRLGV